MKKLVLLLLVAVAVWGQPSGGIPPRPQRVLFANLGTPQDSNWRYCTDCAATAPCTGSGSGAFAYRVGSAWNCNTGSAGGSGLATDGSTTGATSVIQPFTNGIKTTSTTGLVGIGMAPVQMLDITAPASLSAINAVGTQPASSATNGTSGGTIMAVVGPPGGDCTSNSNGRAAGGGASFSFTSGSGGIESGTANSTTRSGNGGTFFFILGPGGNATGATGSVKGGNGGQFTVTGGTGGQAQTHAGISGNGSPIVLTSGTGGDNAVAGGTAGNGGAFTVDAGVAGSASGGATAGTNGVITIGGTNAASISVGNAASRTNITGGVSHSINATSKTADYTTRSSDYTLLFDTSGGAFTLTLSSTNAVAGQTYFLKMTTTSANALTVAPSSGNIDGAASTTITPVTVRESAQVQFDGTNWWIISSSVTAL